MKKPLHFYLSALAIFAGVQFLNAQQKPLQHTVKGPATIHFASLAANELKNPAAKELPHDNEEKEDSLSGQPRNLHVPSSAIVTKINNAYTMDFQSQLISTSPAPAISFVGLSDNNTTMPPDVNGAVGPNQIFETLNSQYRILSKTGAIISTLTLNGFWSGLSSLGTPLSDPHIVYDAGSGHWYACIIGQLNTGHYAIFMAASLTSDARGAWHEYSLDTGPSSTLPDYPLLGYNKNWVVITTNNFLRSVYNRVQINVLNKTKFIAGTLTSINEFFDKSVFGISPAETMDIKQSTEYMLCNYNGNSGGNGYVQFFTITGPKKSPVYTAGTIIGTNQPWSENPVYAPQKGTTELIETNDTRMRSVIVSKGSIWATQTCYLPAASPNRSSTQWWQIKPAKNEVVQFGRIDDATGSYMSAFSSMAVDTNSNVLIGYSYFGSSIYASSSYAFRNAADSKNTLRAPYVYKYGLNFYYKTYGGTRNRWGDYSSTSIDPVDGSFWTLQEFANNSKNTWSTEWAKIYPVAVAGAITAASVSANSNDNTVIISPNPNRGIFNLKYKTDKQIEAQIVVYNINGSVVYSQNIQTLKGINNFTLDLKNAENGRYSVVISSEQEKKQVQFIIEK